MRTMVANQLLISSLGAPKRASSEKGEEHLQGYSTWPRKKGFCKVAISAWPCLAVVA